MYQKKPLTIAIALAFGALSLSGCSSSSGGGGTNDSGSHEPSQPSPKPSYDLAKVRVGVTDTGFDLNEIANSEKVLSTTNVYTMGSDVSSGNTGHGSRVTSIITGDALGNAEVDLYQVEQDGVTQNSALTYGKGLAAERGARVVNSSYAGQHNLLSATFTFNGTTTKASLDKIVNSNNGKGAVLVSGAGNEGIEVGDSGDRLVYEARPDIWEMSLLAVGTEADGVTPHPRSNYPGANMDLQSKTLAANYVYPEIARQGTSLAAAQISAYAAGVIGMWPHMTATEVVDLLLTTASRDSDLYNQNTCGDSGTLNCGPFYLGQGYADIDAALRPQGELAVAESLDVNGESQAASESFAQLSSAYGNSLTESGALDGVAVFDTLGRDYHMDFGAHASQRTGYEKSLRDRMARMSLTSDKHRQTDRFNMGMFQMQSEFDGHGNVVASRFDGQVGNADFAAFNYAGGEIDPTSQYAESGMMPMLSYQGGDALTQGFSDVSGLKTGYTLTENLDVTASHWIGNSNDTAAISSNYKANRSDLGMNYALTDDIRLSSSLGVLNESNGLLGANGSGAMTLGDNNTMTFAGMGLDMSLTNSMKAFANYEYGFGDADTRGLVSELNDIRTQEMALGLQWNGNDKAAAFTVRQPMRLANANATLDVPVGRTLNGEVIRETRHANLAPSGRQVDFELGYGFKPSARSEMQVNLLHSLEPGHDAYASSDTSAMINFSQLW